MSQKIVFLDASTIDYGDIDFICIKELGDFKIYELTRPDEIEKKAGDASVIITNKVILDKAALDKCRKLKLIAVSATGYNNIDIKECMRKNISVANVPGYSTYSVAQLTMSYILAFATNLINYNRASHDGTWSRSPIFTIGSWPTFDLRNKTIGILGLGSIGKEVAGLCKAFGMRVVGLKRNADSNNDIERMSLIEIAVISDFISIHMPLTESTHHLINRNFLASMKKSAYLLNLSRGPIVDPEALLWALETGVIAGAAIDVMEKEPPDRNDPLLKAPNLIITPHIAWASIESRNRLVKEIAENIAAFIKGEKRNIVAP